MGRRKPMRKGVLGRPVIECSSNQPYSALFLWNIKRTKVGRAYGQEKEKNPK